MNASTRTVLTTLVSTALLLGLLGCSTAAPDRSAKAADSIAATHDGLQVVGDQITRTLGSLDVLISADVTNMRGAYDQFAKDVATLVPAADTLKKRSADMQAKKEAYLESWDKDQGQIQDVELRQLALERSAETAAAFDRIRNHVDLAAQTVDPLLSDLNDIRTVIGNDLTPAGRELLAKTKVVQNANYNGTQVLTVVNAALEELTKVATRVSPTGTSPTE